ncbi:hypothetical protein [Streptococcus suis]|uniref:hypothetical protein n=1 Tax=Streptococcus suis TaxID=1307 RepID=UPI00209C0B82|nr:hypothetical protein [Streptococcus suis]MCO8233278.1 hypothetical protein [Streptococcus suis]HEM3542006.1 hypothetical protein [Streptococcus suis]
MNSVYQIRQKYSSLFGLTCLIFFFQIPFFNKLIQGLFQLDLENISDLIQDQLVQGWLRRAILLLLVMVLICLVEIILFYFLTGKLIKAFKLMDGKVNKLLIWSYRLLFWDSIGLLVFGLVTSLSTGLDLWKNAQAIQDLDVQAIGTEIQAIVAEAPLTKIGDVQALFDSIKDYIRDKSILLATKESLVLLHTLISVWSTAYPILLALLSYFHIKDWWTKRTPGKPIVKISLTIERQ